MLVEGSMKASYTHWWVSEWHTTGNAVSTQLSEMITEEYLYSTEDSNMIVPYHNNKKYKALGTL